MEQVEEWRVVPQHPQFSASSLGRIKTHTREIVFIRDGRSQMCRLRGRVISPHVSQGGYYVASFKECGHRKKYFVHRLVGWAFVPGYEVGLSINHKNGNKLDNRPDNLEWTTLAENTAHQWKTGLVNLRGEKHPSAILADEDVLEIRRLVAKNVRKPAIAAYFGVCDSYIYHIASGRKKAFL